MSGPLDVIEGGTGPSWARARWTALPPAGRRLAVLVVVLVLLGGGLAVFRNWSAERELRRAVELTTALQRGELLDLAARRVGALLRPDPQRRHPPGLR